MDLERSVVRAELLVMACETSRELESSEPELIAPSLLPAWLRVGWPEASARHHVRLIRLATRRPNEKRPCTPPAASPLPAESLS